MFENETGSAPTPEQRERLALLDHLAHGDFAAVRQQVEILGDALQPDEFLSQLEVEHRAKPGCGSARDGVYVARLIDAQRTANGPQALGSTR